MVVVGEVMIGMSVVFVMDGGDGGTAVQAASEDEEDDDEWSGGGGGNFSLLGGPCCFLDRVGLVGGVWNFG